MAVGKQNHKDSYGQSVTVSLTATVEGANQLVFVGGWLGFATESGDSGENVNLNIERAKWQIEVPAAFDPAVGAEVYIDTSEVTGHTLNDAAFTTTATSNYKLGRVVEAKDANNVLTLITDLV